ncbi:MAG: hypothetical protein V4587_06695 [Acidobacteriota bacterium]
MTQADSRCPTCGPPVGKQPLFPADASDAQKKEEDRETDHRGVVMPKRTPIGGIIMPQ